ncbi:CotO family spore coat protein [Bacillus salitolerans]|uniref:CotO family spore coat protein n=1 Tax=Bacillus salitolerans TaxID=1437434 RepID=A0ABW4LJE5_9BACI
MSQKDSRVDRNGPLYYITQPKLKPVEVKAQTIFSTKSSPTQKLANTETEVTEIKAKKVPKYLESLGEVQYVERKNNDQEEKKEKSRDIVFERLFNKGTEQEEQHGEQVEEQLQEVEEYQGRKSFKQMNVVEKLDFLLNRPHYIPEVVCAIYANDTEYVGYVKSFEDGVVTVKQLNQLVTLSIDVKDIEQIRLNPY